MLKNGLSRTAMRLGQLIEYNMRNTFFLNIIQNVVEKLIPDPFYCMLSSGLSKYIEIKLQTICFYPMQLF